MSLFHGPGNALESFFYPRGWTSDKELHHHLRAKPAPTNLSLDVRENENSYLVTVEVPGFTSDQISITTEDDVLTIQMIDYSDDVLTIQAEREEVKKSNPDSDHNVVWTERSYGKFSRSLKIPEHVDIKTIKAHQENGLLEITLPKESPKETQSIKNIPITKRQ